MTTRAQDLTADLLHDLTEEQEHPTTALERPPATAASARTERSPSAFVETSLWLAPSGWRRPRLSLDAHTLALSAGPVRLRIVRK